MSTSNQQSAHSHSRLQMGVSNLKRQWGLTFYVRADGTDIYLFEDTRSDTINAWSQIAIQRDLAAVAENRHLVCLYDLRGCAFGPYAALQAYETIEQTPSTVRQSIAVLIDDNAIMRAMQSIIRRLTAPNLQQTILLFTDPTNAELWLSQRRNDMNS